jgi:hypothetical protein
MLGDRAAVGVERRRAGPPSGRAKHKARRHRRWSPSRSGLPCPAGARSARPVRAGWACAAHPATAAWRSWTSPGRGRRSSSATGASKAWLATWSAASWRAAGPTQWGPGWLRAGCARRRAAVLAQPEGVEHGQPVGLRQEPGAHAAGSATRHVAALQGHRVLTLLRWMTARTLNTLAVLVEDGQAGRRRLVDRGWQGASLPQLHRQRSGAWAQGGKDVKPLDVRWRPEWLRPGNLSRRFPLSPPPGRPR